MWIQAIRGPHGIARIELKETAIPKQVSHSRLAGEREDAMNAIISKFLQRGWIKPSKSEWQAQAFIVPKPEKNGQKDWRLVVDYRDI